MVNGIEKSEFLSFLNEKIEYKTRKANEYLESIQQSIRSETKSTAGDKHDTTRELMQQERNKAAQNVSHQLLAQKTIMELRKSKSSKQIGFGSLIQTNRSWIYIGLSIGKVVYKDQDVLMEEIQKDNVEIKEKLEKLWALECLKFLQFL